MKVAYVDTSCLVSIAFGERGSKALGKRLGSFDRLISSNLLEAELMSTLAREEVTDSPAALLANLDWLLPDRPLTAEYEQVLAAGYVRGADLWHLACALYLSPHPEAISFLTLDKQQKKVAQAAGFGV